MCDVVKPLETGFYKAGKPSYHQKFCIPCHNIKRYDYANNRIYIPKPTGFAKLPEETRRKILYDISVRINYKEISEKYGLKYQTLLTWKRKKIIK
jgi:hypothetical protein